MINHDNITLGTSRKHSFGVIWASGGRQRPNQTDNGRNNSCIWHVEAGWKRSTGLEVINHDNITLGHPENTDSETFGPLEASGGQTKQSMVGILVVYGILEQVGSVQQGQK